MLTKGPLFKSNVLNFTSPGGVKLVLTVRNDGLPPYGKRHLNFLVHNVLEIGVITLPPLK